MKPRVDHEIHPPTRGSASVPKRKPQPCASRWGTAARCSRDTCICEMPRRFSQPRYTAACSTNRSARILRSRGQMRHRLLENVLISTRSRLSSDSPSRSPRVRGSSPPADGPSSETGVLGRGRRPSQRAPGRLEADPLARSRAPTAGAQLPFWSCWVAAFALARFSCRRRGTRTAHERSRKWRRISPAMVGVAKVLNSFSGDGWKPLDGLDQAEESDLLDVFEGVAPRLAKRRAM